MHTSGAAPWAIKMPPGTDEILAELFPEALCTWQQIHIHVGWLIRTLPKI